MSNVQDAQRVKLTKLFVDSAKPAANPYWDLTLPRFGLKITPPSKRFPNGNKSHLILYRNGANKIKKVIIGSTTEISLEDARDDARWKLQIVRDGLDPFQVRREREAAQVRALADAAAKSRTVGNLIDLWMVGYVGKKDHSKKYRENIKCQPGSFASGSARSRTPT